MERRVFDGKARRTRGGSDVGGGDDGRVAVHDLGGRRRRAKSRAGWSDGNV
jgi:hypothetical protein